MSSDDNWLRDTHAAWRLENASDVRVFRTDDIRRMQISVIADWDNPAIGLLDDLTDFAIRGDECPVCGAEVEGDGGLDVIAAVVLIPPSDFFSPSVHGLLCPDCSRLPDAEIVAACDQGGAL